MSVGKSLIKGAHEALAIASGELEPAAIHVSETIKHDLRHAAMHHLSDWPVLARLVAENRCAKRLDSRSVAAVYAMRAITDDWAEMSEAERAFAREAISAHAT